jgi:SAM-dependent methyltransferase
VHTGPIGLGVLSCSDVSRFIAPQQVFSANPETQEAVFVMEVGEPFRICVRTAGEDSPGLVEILAVFRATEPRAVKRAGAEAFRHWPYTTDLGDGVVIRATVADEPSWTRANTSARSIFKFLVATFIGNVTGRTILDVACNAGHFSFMFAGMGAKVLGFDHDSDAIEQARFIASQIGSKWPAQAEFMVSDLEEFSTAEAFDVVFCSGVFYHLRDPLGGARKLLGLTKKWLILQSCVSSRPDPVFELSDPAAWPFCQEWEYCLVPSAPMVEAVFRRVGFRVRASYRLSKFEIDLATETASAGGRFDDEAIRSRFGGDPIYLVLEREQ